MIAWGALVQANFYTQEKTMILLVLQSVFMCEQYTCVSKFTACIAFLLYLDDVMRAFRKKKGLVIQDWYFGEGMESYSMCEKGKKRKERQNFVQKLCAHTLKC